MTFYKDINLLPQEIVSNIYEYIPYLSRTLLNKNLYTENRGCIRENIPVLNYEAYIRQTVRKDNDFVFGYLLRENFSKWQHMNNFRYKNFTFEDYVAYIMYLSQEHEASRVCGLIIDKQNKEGKKRHKNVRVRSNTWSN